MNRDLKTLLVIRDYLRSRRDDLSITLTEQRLFALEVERINKLIWKLEAK